MASLSVPQTSRKCRDRAESVNSTATRATAIWNSGIRLLALATERSTPKSALSGTQHV
jgi:hypothetical protein